MTWDKNSNLEWNTQMYDIKYYLSAAWNNFYLKELSDSAAVF